MKDRLIQFLLFQRGVLQTRFRLGAAKTRSPLKIYYGCGQTAQPGYVNVDLRWTPAVDLLGDLEWCARTFEGLCDEVFMSHVLEHYGHPGKAWRDGPGYVPGALRAACRMLKPGGVLRLAVPDFGTLAKMYAEGKVPLYPQLLGRICGGQDYPQNLHKCAFDREFLAYCLEREGFGNVEAWDPRELGFSRDASSDMLEDTVTSLNLCAVKLGRETA